MSIFRNEQEKFLKSIKRIIDRPRHKLRANEIYLRADKLKRLTPQQEQQFMEHRKEPGHLYRTEEQILSNDTMENRFLKHALTQVANRYDKLKKVIEIQRNVSQQMQKEMDDTLQNMVRLQHNPFFRGIGPFKGLTQESQILQKASDYSQVYRSWCLLRKGYSLHDGQYRLQTKDIATLYEIWCFIEVSHIVKELMGEGVDIDHKNRMEMNGMFTWDLGKGENSRILFKKNGIQLAELVYNPKHTEQENDSISMENIVVKTVPQKPDIVLQLTKDDTNKGMKITYLFDAKYRISSKDNGVDTPPEDAINQMHRYRDAIYYQDHESNELKKEVIGGYILFPGYAKTKEDVEKSGFYKSIADVNIGAFPLRPKDEENRQLLVDFIGDLLDMQSTEILDDSIPQKGLHYAEGDPMYFLADIINTKVNDKPALLNGTATSFCCGRKGPLNDVDIKKLTYLAPINNNQFKGIYKIKSIQIKEIEDEQYPTRIEFTLYPNTYQEFPFPIKYGIHQMSARGLSMSKSQFRNYCASHEIKEDISTD